MITLLSPAKNLDFSRNGSHSLTDPRFKEESAKLMGKLKKLSARQLSKLMSINKDLSELNYQRNQSWQSEPDSENVKAAVLAFNGEVYRGLQAKELSSDQLEFAQENIRILSGLYGMLKPLDGIQPYRLEMGSRFAVTPKVKNLYLFWNDKISSAIDDELKNHQDKTVVNVASNEYFKAIDLKALKSKVVHCHFLDFKAGEYKSVMTWAKLARGQMAREIIKNKIEDHKELQKVSFNGYSFNKELSNENEYRFTRKPN